MEKCPVLNNSIIRNIRDNFPPILLATMKKNHQQLTKHSNKGLVKRPAHVGIVGLHIRTFWKKK